MSRADRIAELTEQQKQLWRDTKISLTEEERDMWKKGWPPKKSDGHKHDNGKPRMGLVLEGFAPALTKVAEVGTFGAEKYTDDGWKTVPRGIDRYKDALYRHLLASDGVDSESGLHHMAHAAWNALAILTLMSNDNTDK